MRENMQRRKREEYVSTTLAKIEKAGVHDLAWWAAIRLCDYGAEAEVAVDPLLTLMRTSQKPSAHRGTRQRGLHLLS